MSGLRYALVLGLAFAAVPVWVSPASAAPAVAQVEAARPDARALSDAIRKRAGGSVKRFYAGRDFQPIWIDDGIIGNDAQVLLRYLDAAELDGLKTSRYKPDKLRKAIARADAGDADDLARAEVVLSKAFAKYVSDARRVEDVGIDYADPRLKPEKLGTERILRAATLPSSFGEYIRSMGWMSPHYVQMREILKTALEQELEDHVIDTIRLNLERARHLPSPSVRHIVVDAASARLWYYQAGEEVGTMRVVVGTNETQTPLMAGSLNYAILNPYWNVPDYLVRDNVARKVLDGRSLKSMKMEALSDWSASARKLDPATIDWAAVAAGEQGLRVRELPGPRNSMGKIKFVFPNDQGIYLHDTPNRALFGKEDRHLSNGCIRLENAWALGKWMMGEEIEDGSKKPEQAIPMTVPVPVYLTYLTATPTKRGIGIRPDVYGLDRQENP